MSAATLYLEAINVLRSALSRRECLDELNAKLPKQFQADLASKKAQEADAGP